MIALLRGEFQRNRVLAGLLTGIAVAAVLVLSLSLSHEWNRWSSEGGDPSYMARQWAIHMSFGEAAFLSLLAPLLGVWAAVSIREEKNNALFTLTPRPWIFYLSRWLSVLIFLLVFLSISSTLYFSMMRMGLPWKDVVSSRLTLVSMACAFSALGFWMGIRVTEGAAALVGAYLTVMLMVGQIVLSGPILEGFTDPGHLIYGLLLTNGFAGIASSFHLDMMREGWLYEISPMGLYRFEYPSWQMVFGFYAGMTLVFLGLGLRRPKGIEM
jgi:hypothetical protein